jgi:heme-degrading monooxygenase HmoA
MWAQMITTRIKDGSEEQLEKLFRQLRDAEQAGSGLLRTLALRDQNDPSSLSMLVLFDSEESARARESDPRRADGLAAARATMGEVFDGPPSFTDFTVIEDYTPPG